jgi:hypothetical protein
MKQKRLEVRGLRRRIAPPPSIRERLALLNVEISSVQCVAGCTGCRDCKRLRRKAQGIARMALALGVAAEKITAAE